jgi:hypothetical protein
MSSKTVTITMAGLRGKRSFSGKTLEIVFEKIRKYFFFVSEWGLLDGRLIGTCRDIRYYVSIPNAENLENYKHRVKTM